MKTTEEFLRSLPNIGVRQLDNSEFAQANLLHKEGLVFISGNNTFDKYVCITFEGRRFLSRAA